MDGYLKRQLLNQRRGTPLQARRTEDALYASCLPQASGTGAHPLTMVRHLASQGPCWDGYKRDYSKEKYSDGSCVKDGKGKKKKKKDKKEKEKGDASSSSSSSDDEDDKPKKKRDKKDDK
jgi:hypothetical protein